MYGDNELSADGLTYYLHSDLEFGKIKPPQEMIPKRLRLLLLAEAYGVRAEISFRQVGWRGAGRGTHAAVDTLSIPLGLARRQCYGDQSCNCHLSRLVTDMDVKFHSFTRRSC